MNPLKTRLHCTLHWIGTVHVYIQAVAFSAGLNSIQVDQVKREDNSWASIPDRWRREHILSWTEHFAVASITAGYSCCKTISSLITQHPCFFPPVYDDLWNSLKGHVFVTPGPLGTPYNHTKNHCTTLPVVLHFRMSHYWWRHVQQLCSVFMDPCETCTNLHAYIYTLRLRSFMGMYSHFTVCPVRLQYALNTLPYPPFAKGRMIS